MGRFFAGFLVASLCWGGAFYAERMGMLEGLLGDTEEVVVAAEPPPEVEEPPEEEASPRRRRRRRRRTGMGTMGSGLDNREGASGDDLGEDEPRELDGAGTGGEAQLASSQIEQVFDGAFRRIQRCLILAPEDAPPAQGRLTFGLRIAGSGRVTRVNLRGPRSVSQGEAGSCLRGVARSMQFPSFDGPEMLVRYPITLE